MGANDLVAKPGIKQLRHPADVIDVGVGQKQIVYLSDGTGNWAKCNTGASPEAVTQSTRILMLSLNRIGDFLSNDLTKLIFHEGYFTDYLSLLEEQSLQKITGSPARDNRGGRNRR